MSDVSLVREKLLAICSENKFTVSLKAPISQKLFDEIETAISKGWCNCKPNDDDCCWLWGWEQVCMRIAVLTGGVKVPVLFTSGSGAAATKEVCQTQISVWQAAVTTYAATHGVKDQLEFREPTLTCEVPCG
jgi:hypothetical protein